MRPFLAAAAAITALFVAGGSASARPTKSARVCTDSQTMKIPLAELNKCALNGGSMKCTAGGYECCYDGGSYCEWQPYSSRAGANILPPSGGGRVSLPPGSGRPDVRVPTDPASPPKSLPPRGPRFDAEKIGPMKVAQPNRGGGPRVK